MATEWRVERSDTFYHPWREYVVNVYEDGRCVMRDMSPSILKHIKMPDIVVRASEQTVRDGEMRVIVNNRIRIRPTLIRRPPKPVLIKRRKS